MHTAGIGNEITTADAAAKLDKKCQPTRLIRARPWLARRCAAQPPAQRYKAKIRTQWLVMGQVLFVPVQVLSGKFLVVPVILAGSVNGWRAYRDLRHNPDHFFIREQRTRELLDRYDREIDAGTWAGPGPSALTILGLPLAVAAILLVDMVLIGKGSFLGFGATGLLIGMLAAVVDVVRHRRTKPDWAPGAGLPLSAICARLRI